MSLLEKAQAAWLSQMSDIANRICDDYKSAVQANLKYPGDSTGIAVGSIHVEQLGDTKYRIGAANLHLFFFEEGNGPGRIYPKNGKALAFPGHGEYRGRGNGKNGKWVKSSVNSYEGKHINKEVAAKYG